MKPSPFRYFAPDSLEEVISLLAEHPASAKVLAGGQSLVPLMAFRLATPGVLVDLRNVASLSEYDLTGRVLTIGSMVTHRAVELDRAITARCQMIGEALDVVGHVAIRNVGTVGGSLAHADPAAEWPALALALDGQMTIRGTSGERVVAAEDFFVDWMTTAASASEVLTAVRLTLPGDNSGSAFEEVARRHGDFGIVGVAAVVVVDGPTVTDSRISLLGAATTPMRARAAEARAVGGTLSPVELTAVGDVAASEIKPLTDLHGSADYKRRLAATLTRRALARAYGRARSAA